MEAWEDLQRLAWEPPQPSSGPSAASTGQVNKGPADSSAAVESPVLCRMRQRREREAEKAVQERLPVFVQLMWRMSALDVQVRDFVGLSCAEAGAAQPSPF